MKNVYHSSSRVICLSSRHKTNVFGSKEDNLLAISLAYNLTSTFNKKMGLEFCGAEGSLPGRVIIVAVSISGGKEALDIAESKTCFKYRDNSFWNS